MEIKYNIVTPHLIGGLLVLIGSFIVIGNQNPNQTIQGTAIVILGALFIVYGIGYNSG